MTSSVLALVQQSYKKFRVLYLSELCTDGVAKLTITADVQLLLVDDCIEQEKKLEITVAEYARAHVLLTCAQELQYCHNLSVICQIQAHAYCSIVVCFAHNYDYSTDVTVQMDGLQAQAEVHALYECGNNNTATLKTLQYHNAESTQSSVTMRALVSDKAACSYEGMIIITEKARLSSAQQEHKALLLSEHARAVALPQLEVLTNDVQCGHGSAVGVLDFEQLWYMQMRGISRPRARELLIENFMQQAVSEWLLTP